jgi:hypothetical protein
MVVSNKDASEHQSYAGIIGGTIAVGGAAAVGLMLKKGKGLGGLLNHAADEVGLSVPEIKLLDPVATTPQHVIDSYVQSAKKAQESVEKSSEAVVPKELKEEATIKQQQAAIDKIKKRNKTIAKLNEPDDEIQHLYDIVQQYKKPIGPEPFVKPKADPHQYDSPIGPKLQATKLYDNPIGPKPRTLDDLSNEVNKEREWRDKFKDNPSRDKLIESFKKRVKTDENGIEHYDDVMYADTFTKPGQDFQDNVYSHGFAAFGANKWISDPEESIVNGLTNMEGLFKNKDSIQISASDGMENIGDFGVYVKGDVHANFKKDINSSKDPLGDNRRVIHDWAKKDEVTDFDQFKEASSHFDNFTESNSRWTESIMTPHTPIGVWYKEDSAVKDLHLDYMKQIADQHQIPITKVGKEGNEIVYGEQYYNPDVNPYAMTRKL